VLVAEVVVLTVATVVDTVLALRTPAPEGLVATVLQTVVPYVGTAVAVLAVLRRRFPRRVELLGYAVVGSSLLSTGGRALSDQAVAHPVATEVVAAVLLAGTGCRRLPPVRAAALAVAVGVAVVAAPIVRYGVASPPALLAVPAALLWGVALAIGLILRDADARHAAELERARTGDRLQVARELHDLVAHHVSGIVVRVRAAQSVTADPAHAEIEEAAVAALGAMRELVGMLRSTGEPLASASTALGDVVRTAVADRATVVVADDVDRLPLPPELAVTLHRVVLEALTNARRHAPRASEVRVAAHTDDGDLVLDVANDGVTAGQAGDGYGLLGMSERVSAVGGTVDAGPRPGGRWRVTVRVPLGDGEIVFPTVPRGV
jgi:signal transduction histidine kinase